MNPVPVEQILALMCYLRVGNRCPVDTSCDGSSVLIGCSPNSVRNVLFVDWEIVVFDPGQNVGPRNPHCRVHSLNVIYHVRYLRKEIPLLKVPDVVSADMDDNKGGVGGRVPKCCYVIP